MGSLPRRDGARGNNTLESTIVDSAFTNRHEGILGFEISYVYYVNILVDCMRFMEGIGSRRSLVQVLRVLIEGQRSWMIDTAWKFRYVSQHERFCEILEVLCRYVASGQSRGIQDDFRMLLRMVETYQIHHDKMLQMRRLEASQLAASGRIEDAYNVLAHVSHGSARDAHHELLGMLRRHQLYNVMSRYESEGAPFKRAGRYAQQLSQEARVHFQRARDTNPLEISHHMRMIEMYTIEGDDTNADEACLLLCNGQDTVQDHFDVHAQRLVLLLRQMVERPESSDTTIEQARECCDRMIEIDPTSVETEEIAMQLKSIARTDDYQIPRGGTNIKR